MLFEPNTPVDKSKAWERYCTQRAINELGRVLRNPCNQLVTTHLQDDPDMERLAARTGGRLVAVIAGIGH